jgi:hypothetical protein
VRNRGHKELTSSWTKLQVSPSCMLSSLIHLSDLFFSSKLANMQPLLATHERMSIELDLFGFCCVVLVNELGNDLWFHCFLGLIFLIEY